MTYLMIAWIVGLLFLPRARGILAWAVVLACLPLGPGSAGAQTADTTVIWRDTTYTVRDSVPYLMIVTTDTTFERLDSVPAPPPDTTLPPPPPSETGSFFDGFEAGQRTDSAGFVWGVSGGNVNVVHRDSMVEAIPTGSYALEFYFRASDQISAEQRFFYPDTRAVVVEYDVYVPSDFVHADDPTHSLDNNKLLALWDFRYDTGQTVIFEYVRTGDVDSRLRAFNSSGINPEYREFAVPLITDDGPMRRGEWSRVRVEAVAASGPDTNDGSLRFSVNGNLLAEVTGQPFWVLDPTAWDSLYIFGAANAGFVQDTYLYVDNLTVTLAGG